MKKIIAILLTTFLVSGCSSGVSQSEYDKVVQERDALKTELAQLKGEDVSIKVEQSKTEKPKTDVFDRKTISDQLILTDYIIDSKYSDYVITTIQNTSGFDLQVKINQSYKDVGGNVIGVKSQTEYCLASGGEVALWSTADDLPASVENSVDAKESMYTGFTNLSYETTQAGKKIIITATNNESKPISFLNFVVVFFNGETPVGFDSGYIIDTDDELKAGSTLSAEAEERESFDNYKVYFSGRIQ